MRFARSCVGVDSSSDSGESWDTTSTVRSSLDAAAGEVLGPCGIFGESKRLVGGDGAALVVGTRDAMGVVGAKLVRGVYVGGVGSAGKNSEEAGILEGSRNGEEGSMESVLMAGPIRSAVVVRLEPVVFVLFELPPDGVSECFEVTLFAVLVLLLLERPECPDPGLEAPGSFVTLE